MGANSSRPLPYDHLRRTSVVALQDSVQNLLRAGIRKLLLRLPPGNVVAALP